MPHTQLRCSCDPSLTQDLRQTVIWLQDIVFPCIYAMNAFLRGDADLFRLCRSLHRDAATAIQTAIRAACFHVHGAYAAADDDERADMRANVCDVFNLVEVRS